MKQFDGVPECLLGLGRTVDSFAAVSHRYVLLFIAVGDSRLQAALVPRPFVGELDGLFEVAWVVVFVADASCHD